MGYCFFFPGHFLISGGKTNGKLMDLPRLTERQRKAIGMLARSRHRQETGQMLIEGVRSVEAAVMARAPIDHLVLTETALDQDRVRSIVAAATFDVFLATEREMKQISDVDTHQGIVAIAWTPLFPVDDVQQMHRVLALDGVQDPGNVGTIVRTAAWFGIDAVVAGAGTADFFNPKVIRSAMGGLWDVRLTRTEDLAHTMAALRQQNFLIAGADLEGSDLGTWAPGERCVLVMGSEAHGLSPAVKQQLDQRLAIHGSPNRRGTESLNVASACAIFLYQWQQGASRLGRSRA